MVVAEPSGHLALAQEGHDGTILWRDRWVLTCGLNLTSLLLP